MTLKPPTKTFHKLVMKEWPEKPVWSFASVGPINTAEVGLILLRRKLELTPGGGCGLCVDLPARLQ